MGASFLKRSSIRVTPWQAILVFALIAITAFTIPFGMRLRIDAFNWSTGIHHSDLFMANRRGTVIEDAGILNAYDKIASPYSAASKAGIDYAPLRLAAIGLWTRWFNTHYPDTRWTDSYEYTWPLLVGNTLAELISAVLVFLLIWTWKRRSLIPTTWSRGIVTAFIGAMFFWFNPALIWNAHCWPQWDVWLVPFFLAAVLCASFECWFIAGISIGIGAFFKGQILLVCPIFLLYPLFQLRWQPPIRLLAGFAMAALAIAMPWMGTGGKGGIATFIAAFLVVSTITIWLRPRIIRGIDWFSLNALLFSASIFLILPLFGASTTWFTIGFEYGSQKFTGLTSAEGTYNIPSMLEKYFDWPNDMNAIVAIAGNEIAIRKLMFAIYALCLIACAIAAAVYDRQRSSRFLLAMFTPWICFFCLLTQMNNRYLVWAAVLSSLLIAVGPGLALLGLVLSAICVTGMSQHMLTRGFAPDLIEPVQAMQTHLAWAVTLICLVYLYQSVVPARRPRPVSDLTAIPS